MFKWACLLVAVVALTAFGWMLNDMRLQVRGLTQKADDQLPKILNQTEKATTQLDAHLPRILTQAEKATTQMDTHLPRILAQTEQATTTINKHLPPLFVRAEVGLDHLIDLSDSFKQYRGLMGIVHVAAQNKSMFSYATSLLGHIGGTDAVIGVKRPGANTALRQVMSAKEWANSAQKDAHFVSLIAKSKEDVLHGLARTRTQAPLHIQIGDQPPRLLADWVKEGHAESKDLKW